MNQFSFKNKLTVVDEQGLLGVCFEYWNDWRELSTAMTQLMIGACPLFAAAVTAFVASHLAINREKTCTEMACAEVPTV